MENKDPSIAHFYISIVKSAWRIVAGIFLFGAAHLVSISPDLYGVDTLLMYSAASFVWAEILGIIEEL